MRRAAGRASVRAVAAVVALWATACGDAELASGQARGKDTSDGTTGGGAASGAGGTVDATARSADAAGGASGDTGPPIRDGELAIADGSAVDGSSATPVADGAPPTTPPSTPPTVPPGGCDPVNQREVDGRCVSSCGGAGGNTCVAADSTLCHQRPLLESWDCAICCAVPPLPPIRPNGFHTTVIADEDRWDSIWEMAQADVGPIVVSDNKHPAVPFEKWTKRVSITRADTGAGLADVIDAELGNPAGAPIKVIVDELRDDSQQKVTDLARDMAARYPQWRGRWGVYLVNGAAVHYANYSEPLDALLDAGAMIAAEMYPSASDYCAAGPRAIDGDLWLARFFRGDERIARLHWLVNRKASRGSDSHISVVFGVNDRFFTGVTPAVFLDRMFYVFATRSDHRELIEAANGGPGAWKWQAVDAEDGVVISNSSRDLAFRGAFEHYITNGSDMSRLGQVDCP